MLNLNTEHLKCYYAIFNNSLKMIITVFIFTLIPNPRYWHFFCKVGFFFYLYFVPGVLLSITQLSGFVSTGLSLGGQLKKPTQNIKVLVLEMNTTEKETTFLVRSDCSILYLYSKKDNIFIPPNFKMAVYTLSTMLFKYSEPN